MSARRPLTLGVVIAVLGVVCFALPRKPRQDYPSPDRKLIAAVIEVNEAHESRVEIRTARGKLLLTQNFTSDDMEHGQSILKAAWTPDAGYFVFSMENTGGHSVMARPTLFYSRKQNRLFNLEDTVGFVTEADFKLEAPNWIVTEVDEVRRVRVALSEVQK